MRKPSKASRYLFGLSRPCLAVSELKVFYYFVSKMIDKDVERYLKINLDIAYTDSKRNALSRNSYPTGTYNEWLLTF